jgi:hypothetical protein
MSRARGPILLMLLAAVAGCAARPPAGPPPGPTPDPAHPISADARFDPARHMRVSEVRPGMRGHGLTVLLGVEPTRFEVEVISVLRNLMGPKQDVILIRASGAGLERSGAIAGMSGSPIYLRDEAGRDRLVGAFAYGWPLAREPIAGVQPIEAMLQLDPRDAGEAAEAPGGDGGGRGGVARIEHGMPARHDLAATPLLAWMRSPDGEGSGVASAPIAATDPTRPTPLLVPLSLSGFTPGARASLDPALRAMGYQPLQAAATTTTAASVGRATLQPGAAVAVPLVTGDFEAVATGTITEVLGDEVFAFGHPLNGEGETALPMALASVQGVVPLLSNSFKIGSVVAPLGTVRRDERAGIAGVVGDVPAGVPVEMTLLEPGQAAETLRFTIVSHETLTASMLAATVESAMALRRELPTEHTLRYDATLRFAGGREVRLANVDVGEAGATGLQGLLGPLVAIAMQNPFEPVPLQSVTLRVAVEDVSQAGQIESVTLDRRRYRPGGTAKATVRYREHRGGERTLVVAFPIPAGLAAGDYTLEVGDWQQHLLHVQQTQPFRFQSTSIDELFDVVRDYVAVRHDAVYVRLQQGAAAVAVGRVPMERLPSSRRQLLASGGRSDVTSFESGATRVVPTTLVLGGSASAPLKVEVAGPAGVRPGDADAPARAREPVEP